MTMLLLAAVMNMGGVEVNGTWVTKTERREFADGYAERYVLPEGRRSKLVGTVPRGAGCSGWAVPA